MTSPIHRIREGLGVGENGNDRGEGGQDGRFDHERLEAYQATLAFIEWRSGILKRLPSTHYMVNQLDRACTSIAANIGEGSGEKPGPERWHFYRIARRSATECSALLDVIAARRLEPARRVAEGKALIRRIIAMLTVLAHMTRNS